MLEMISMLQDFQSTCPLPIQYDSNRVLTLTERKARSSTQSSAFAAKKNALYDQARKNASTAVRDGVAYMSVPLAICV